MSSLKKAIFPAFSAALTMLAVADSLDEEVFFKTVPREASMDVSLTPELERLIHKKVETGHYLSASEVVQEALRLLEERDKLQALKFEELRQEIQIGIDQADQGRVAPLDVQGTLAKVRSRRKAETGGA